MTAQASPCPATGSRQVTSLGALVCCAGWAGAVTMTDTDGTVQTAGPGKLHMSSLPPTGMVLGGN